MKEKKFSTTIVRVVIRYTYYSININDLDISFIFRNTYIGSSDSFYFEYTSFDIIMYHSSHMYIYIHVCILFCIFLCSCVVINLSTCLHFHFLCFIIEGVKCFEYIVYKHYRFDLSLLHPVKSATHASEAASSDILSHSTSVVTYF